MKTIQQFQEENEVCIEAISMTNVTGGSGESTKRETWCTGANGGDSEIWYYTDDNKAISVDGTRLDGTSYHENFQSLTNSIN